MFKAKAKPTSVFYYVSFLNVRTSALQNSLQEKYNAVLNHATTFYKFNLEGSHF